MDPVDGIKKDFYEGVPGNIEDKSYYDAHRKKDKEKTVLFRMDRCPLHGKHECSGKPRKNIDQDKINDTHVRQPEKIA